MLSESPGGGVGWDNAGSFGKFARRTALTLACLGSPRNAARRGNRAEFRARRARFRGSHQLPRYPMLHCMGKLTRSTALILGGMAPLFVLPSRVLAQAARPSATASFPPEPAPVPAPAPVATPAPTPVA